MASFDRCSFKIVWIIVQVILHLISPYTTLYQFSSYAALIDHPQQLHPSENPDCPFRSSKDQSHVEKFKYQENYSMAREPSIEVRAILVPCQVSFEKKFDEHLPMNTNETFYGDPDTSDHERIKNCHKKLIITVKMNNVGKIKTEDEYIVVSHVLNSITMQRTRLQNPYVIKIRREPVLQLYRLKFEKVVNAEAREQIIITKETNYTRCNDGIENPTCGLLLDDGIPVPYSQGFCCSCDAGANLTRRTRESEERTGNFSPKVKTIQEESTNRSSNRSKSRVAYDRPFNDSLLPAVAQTDGIGRKQGHLIYNSRKLKENNINNKESMIDNMDNYLNYRQKINKDNKTRLVRKAIFTKNSTVEDMPEYVDKNKSNLDNASGTILFSSKIPTKGKIEAYIDAIQEEARRDSRNLKNIENTSSLDYKDFVIESPVSSKGSRYEKCKERKEKYEDIEPGCKNLMDELTELEKAYDALKKMRRSKKEDDRSSVKDSSYERARENLEEKELEPVDNIEKNAKETLLDKRKMKMDAKVNENKMRETRRCFLPRKKKRMGKRKTKEDRGDSNSGKSMETLASRLDEFQARPRLGGKIYEDQSRDIEATKKMEFAKYPLTKNESINGIAKLSNDFVIVEHKVTLDNALSPFSADSRIRKFNGKTIEPSRESEVFALLTRLLVPDEEILRNLDVLEVKRGTKNVTALRYNGTNEDDVVPRFAIGIQKSMRDGRKKLKREDKYNSSSSSLNLGNMLKKIETDSQEKDGPRSVRVYLQRPDFDLVTDKYLNEPLTDFNSSDNPFLIDDDARRNGIDKHIEEKFGRISEVLKEASDEAKHIPLRPKNETSSVTNEKTKGILDERLSNVNVLGDRNKIGDIDISRNNERTKGMDRLENEKIYNLSGDSRVNLERPSSKVPWNFDKAERNENAADRIGHVEISPKAVPTTNFVEFKGGTRPLVKVIPRDKSSFSSNPVNGVERYTKKRPGKSADRINVRASNGSKQISDLIINRSRLNSTIVVVDGSRPGENGVSYLNVENSGIVLRKINSSGDTKTKLLYKMKGSWKTPEKGRTPRNYSDLNVSKESNKLANKRLTNGKKNPREIIFYEYNFEDDNDDHSYDFGRKSRTLLSISFDDTSNQDEDEFDSMPHIEYEDYSYPKTDSTKDKNQEDSMEDISDFNSMIPAKRKIYIEENNYDDFNKGTSSNDVHNRKADKYIKQMSRVIAHRGKPTAREIKKHKKIIPRESKVVKKHVNDVPFYDFVSTQEVSDDAKETKNFDHVKNLNFIPENWNEKMNIDDVGIYDKKFDQNRGKYEKLSFVDSSNYNIAEDKSKSSKLFPERSIIEKTNEFSMDPRKNFDQTDGNIDISVNGNIHVEGGIKGHPISIAFVAVPDIQPDSPTIRNDSNFGGTKSEDSTSGVIKLNEIVPAEPNYQDNTGFNVAPMSNAFPTDLGKSKEESNQIVINNNNDEELLERNRSLFSSLEPQNHIYNDVYQYGDIEKTHEDQVTPDQRFFVFNSKLNEADAKYLNSNGNFESSFVEEYEDDTKDDTDLKNLAREKKEVEDFDYRMTDGLANFMEEQSNDTVPVNDVTLIKIIPEKLFDNVPSAMKDDFSNNFEAKSYGENLSLFEIPFSNDSTSIKFDSANDYANATSRLGSYNLTDPESNSMIFPIIFETTVQPADISQDWYKDGTSKEMTTISKITEPEVLFRTMITPRLSISDTQSSVLKQKDNVTSTQAENKFRGAERGQAFHQTSSTTRTTNETTGDSCFKMKITVKKLNLSETTTSAPTTTVNAIQNNSLGISNENNPSETQNSTIRERNASAIANFIKKLQTFAPNKKKSQLKIREIIIVPEDTCASNTTKSNDYISLKINSDEVTDERNKTRLGNPDKSIPIFSSSSNDALGNLTIAGKDSTKENRLRKKAILESNPKLLPRTSKGSFYPSSGDCSGKEQQRQQSSSGSSTKRLLSGNQDGSDKSFLFYAQQKQPVGLPELLVKSQVGGDIDWDPRSARKRVFLGRNKRNEQNGVASRSSEKKIKDVNGVSSLRHSSNVKERAEVKKRVDPRKSFAGEDTRLPRFNKRKLEKRKKKMDTGEIKKLTGIRRRKKKKKKKKIGNQENTLDIPEVKTKWRLVKRNLLSVGTSESGKLKKKLDKKRDDGDLEITRKMYEESNASQMGRVSDGNFKKKKKKNVEEVEDAGSTLIRRRQSRTDGKQVRGGQDCSNRDHPVDIDESKYFESAHCLRFSDLWYSVYRLDEPILDHGVSVQLYEKRSLPDGTTRWEDLTPSMIRLNTFSKRYRNNDDSLAFTYRAKREPSKQFPASLDTLEDRLLVPSTVSSGKSFKVAESKGIFEEYLIVRANEISADGNECDKIGVGFKAFVDQPDRCRRLEGTCLKYQPLSYWKRDREAREAGRAGCYFLSNFASVPSEPIKYNVSGSGSGEFLALEYHSPHVSAIDIEVRNDYNGVASSGPLGRISHIYVDSTSLVHTIVTIVIRNVGSTPTVFRPRIVECPRGLPISWSNAGGIAQMILPRQNRRVAFDLYGELPFNDFECTVELLDRRGKTVASRRMRVRKMDRCFCVWHCLCACVGSVDGSSCRPMSTAHYRAAGFQPPVPAAPMRSSSFLGSLFDFLLFLFSLLALLLAMGISKWIIGIYVPAVGRWGLDTLLESTRMREYFEEELKCRCIVTDESGFPVHPDTGSRSIRICSRKAEFFLNVTFFLIYPITVCWYRMKEIFRWTRYGSSSTSNDESKACLTSDRDEYQDLVTVSTYGDGRNSKMEAEDTNYVMNELKRSQESLQEYNRYKRYRYYMENQGSRY